jgi:hypothetical protein
MRLFIAPRTGIGTRADPFRPDIDRDDVGGEWGAYEMPDGRFTCVAPNATTAPANTTDLGNDVEAPLPPDTFATSGIGGGTGTDLDEPVDVSGMTVGEAILTIDGNIEPDHLGRVQVVIAGVVLYDAPAIQGGATDSFTYSNGALATVSSGAWVNHLTGLSVSSNQVIASGFAVARWSTAFTTTHFSQLDIVTQPNPGGSKYSDGEVWTRMTTSGETGIAVNLFNNGGTLGAELYVATSGSYTQKYSASIAGVTGTIKLESSGSTHTYYRNGSVVTTQTDGSLNSNTYVGIGVEGVNAPGNCVVDNWVGGDISTGSTGTLAVTEADDTIVASGAQTHVGTIAVTDADDTIVADGNQTHTGTLAVTEADDTMAASGDVSGSGANTGTLAVTEADDTMVAVGTWTITGTIAVTDDADTIVAVGTITITGTIAVTEADDTMAATSIGFAYPVAVSGRKLVDQTGNLYLLRNIATWCLPQNASNAEITTALEALAPQGFKSVAVIPCGVDHNATGSGWVQYQNKAGANFFTGTAFQSSLGPAWSSMDWVMTEATRLALTVVFSVAYTGYGNSQGIGDELIAAGTINAYNYGAAVAARYANYPNIVWHHGADTDFDYGTPPSQVVDAVFHGIRDTEGSTHRLVLAEPNEGRSSYDQFISQEGASGSGYQWLQVDANSVYDYGHSTVDQFDAVYTETGATTLPVWDCEIPYRGATWPTTGVPTAQELRERVYGTLIRGGIGVNYGDADMFQFGLTALGGGGDSSVWGPTLTRAETQQAGHAYLFADEHINHASWSPTNSLVTTGTGTGDTKAAAGTSGSKAVAYFPNNRTIVADTTIISGAANVRLRWWDPVAFTYSDIATSEAQNASRSVTLPAARGDGTRDFVLVVDTPTTGGAYIGTTPITNLRIGTTLVTKLYVGTTQIV